MTRQLDEPILDCQLAVSKDKDTIAHALLTAYSYLTSHRRGTVLGAARHVLEVGSGTGDSGGL